ncbi:hypothetical protein [Desulfovibrio sp. ZJ200]|uniref:hypothetical protein n=1 Tax=Desulfovibrio sp. ZJ200 TaxID=2709792 RepID=UPI0013ED29FE|nr:hypothetical protein [Desulfovibrio sp. ZJ200]
MDIPLVNVTAQIRDQQGRPVHRAQIVMRLTTVERYCGLIVPREARAETDPQGRAVLKVWPNELGTESSEYMVTVTFPEACQVSGGKHPSHLPPLRSLRYHATVPNAHCNLHDIAELPPYEQRGAGQIITSEVAAYAAEAGRYAAAAESTRDAVSAVESGLNALADQAEAAKTAAQESARQAQGHELRAREMVDGVADTVGAFEHTVVERTEQTAARLTADATACITQYKADALQALEIRSGDVLSEISQTASDAQVTTVNAVAEAGAHAVGEIDGARNSALAALREEAALFGEDFENLTERALDAAKRAGCSSASTQNSATRACQCAERAENAAQGLERHRDEALDAARRAESAQSCVESAGQRAAAAADMARQNADYAAGSAKAAQEAAKAVEAGVDLARQSADMAVAAQQATAQDKAYVQGVADDAERAVHDVAVDMLTPQVITQAVDRATAEAEAHAQAAAHSAEQSAASATEAARQANLATERADRAQAAQSQAEDAAQRAETAADSAAEKAEALITRMAEGMFASWTLVQGVNEGGLLPLPEGCGYYPGHHAVRLSWDGLACHQNRQWEEAGEKGALSHAVRLLFAAPADSDFEVNIAAHADVPEAGAGASILEERLTRMENTISDLSNRAVSYAELPQA